MENKAKAWIARDKDGDLFVYSDIPIRCKNHWGYPACFNLDKSMFPSIKWEDDEPTEAYITLIEPQEQPAKEIDWEQRRYEMIRDMIVRKWLSDIIIKERQFPYSENDDIASAIKYADRVINELKKQSE